MFENLREMNKKDTQKLFISMHKMEIHDYVHLYIHFQSHKFKVRRRNEMK